MRSRQQRMVAVLLVLGVMALVTACGTDDEPSTRTTGAPTTLLSATTSTTGTPVDETIVRAYLLRGEEIGPVAREATGEAVAAGAIEGLLTGPTQDEHQLGFSSAIPPGTHMRSVVINDRVATIDLSEEFGSGGGSASMMGRVAQVVFTLTQFPTVDAVLFELEGEPVTALGGEGLLLDEPQTRTDWEELSPAILIEEPLPFAEVTSPVRITGTANTFEAAFRVNVTDGEGLIVYDEPAMATSGTGTRGTFDITATFQISRPGFGSVIVFEESAQDGRQINLVEVPIRVSA